MNNAPKRIWITNVNKEELKKFEEAGYPLTYSLKRIKPIDIEYIRADLFMCAYNALQSVLRNKRRGKDIGWETQIIEKALDIINNPDKFKTPDSMEDK
jgi:hypothetical protein